MADFEMIPLSKVYKWIGIEPDEDEYEIP